jgi:hypothetical protein
MACHDTGRKYYVDEGLHQLLGEFGSSSCEPFTEPGAGGRAELADGDGELPQASLGACSGGSRQGEMGNVGERQRQVGRRRWPVPPTCYRTVKRE